MYKIREKIYQVSLGTLNTVDVACGVNDRCRQAQRGISNLWLLFQQKLCKGMRIYKRRNLLVTCIILREEHGPVARGARGHC